jgi:uncharacterized LabA/DUF88 family protein
MVVPPTPKFKSAGFKETLGLLKETFDAHSLGVVLLDALERRAAEQLFARFAPPPPGARLANVRKAEIVGQLTAGFFASEEVAFQLVRELDRASEKERHIVASIPEEHAPDRIGSYRAIALKRERAKLVWALARDARAPVRTLASKIIAEFFAEAADVESARALLGGEDDGGRLRDVDFARRMQDQAERLTEASARVSDLETKLGRFEEERARLLAQMGAKERSLRQEAEAREDLEGQLEALRRSLQEVEAAGQLAEAARAGEERARLAADDLAQKVRRLSKLAGAAQVLREREDELAGARRRVTELERLLADEARGAAEAAARHAEAERRLRAELDELREDLRAARRQLAETARGGEAPRVGGDGRVLVLLDQANLAASAHATWRRKVNFAGLLDHLRGGRPLARAVAFVVDNGGQAFEAFVDTLRRSGWDVRVKRPKVFASGATKADWDVGLAVAAFELVDAADVVVLASGDGDFAPLAGLLRRRGKRVEVAAFADGLSQELALVADHVERLGDATLE